MLHIDLKHCRSFLPEQALQQLQPSLLQAQDWLQQGTGAGGEYTGWVRLPCDYDREELARMQAAAEKIRGDSGMLLVIGIGGSYLGARGAWEFLLPTFSREKRARSPQLLFSGNGLSADAMAAAAERLENTDWSINVISKSGTTTEPAVAFRFFRELLERRYGPEEAARRIYVTTDRSRGALRQLALSRGYESFAVPDDIGGRYSVLSAVGLLPLAAAGADVKALLSGAAEMRQRCLLQGEDNPAWQYAAARSALYRQGTKIEILGCYEPSFRFMGEWWKQLFGESEGKGGKGLFPASVELTADLHSMGQYIQQGPRDLLETIVRFGPSAHRLTVPVQAGSEDGLAFLAGRSLDEIQQQAMDGTLLAHVEGGVPNIVINAGEKNERSLGQLIYFFEYACGLSAYLLQVNPFDQPGVEAYKRNMYALLGKPGYEQERARLEAGLRRGAGSKEKTF